MPETQKSSNRTLTMKFGGTSVGSPEAITNAIKIIQDTLTDWPRLAVVISAMSGVTNLLLDGANRATQGEQEHISETEETLLEKHGSIAETVISNKTKRQQIMGEISDLVDVFGSTCRAIAVLGEATPRAMDTIASLGERMSVRLFSAALESAGTPSCFVEATKLIETDHQYQAAHPDFESTTKKTRAVLHPILAQGQVPIVTGFIGAAPDGVITTLGRGGSDYSAAIIGAVLPADEVWIWTDVNGVMTADPRTVPEAQTLPQITYREVAELAYYGAKVLHPKTIRPVVESGIGLRICNTFEPKHPGTRLVNDSNNGKKPNGDEVIKAVTAIRAQKLVTIEGRGMLGVPGVAARAFGAVASTGTSVPLITQASSEQSICFAVPVEVAEKVLSALKKTFEEEIAIRDIDRVWTTEEVSIITVVGKGMKDTPGVAGRIFSTLGNEGVNVLAIAQGSSEVSISLVVIAEDTENAIKSLHKIILANKK
ncbi:MAG: aspartate kinase [Anaerolineales bacterium]|nr:aspartate kinase [Anaerolineales bacterium]